MVATGAAGDCFARRKRKSSGTSLIQPPRFCFHSEPRYSLRVNSITRTSGSA
jgi:hypothetical protein